MLASLPTAFRKSLTLLAYLCLSSQVLLGQPKPFQAGTAVVDIAPTDFPVIVNAMFTERSADKVVDPLLAKALTLDDGTNRIAFCIVDSCMVPRDLLDQAKGIASKATGIPTENMMISATHTHSAPSAMGCLGSRVDPRYAAMLPARIAQAIIESTRNLQPVQIASTAFDDWDHTFNRRWIRRPDRVFEDPFGQKNVRAHMHPGHESPDAVGPSGPVDPQLSFFALRHKNGSPIAVLANYSMHYYESQLLSSDYFGRFALHLANFLQATNGFVGIMSQGTSGDLMWMDYGAPRKVVGYDTYAREIARRVADAYSKLQWKDHVPIRIAQRSLALNYRVPDPSRLAWARAKAAALGDKLPQSLPDIYALEAIYLHEKQNTELLLQAIRIGDLGIATLPNEVYAITGLKLKVQSPFPIQMNIELANGAEGYIPPPEQHRLGGYTTWPARTAGLETAAEPRIVENLLQLLEIVAEKSRTPLRDEPSPYPQTVLKDRPFAYWRLNEIVTPSASDSSGHRQHAQIEDGVAVYLPGVGSGTGISPNPALTPSPFSGSNGLNRAYHFAGGRLKTTATNLGSTYSVELWFWNGLPHTARAITGHLFSLGADGVYGAPGEHLSIGGRASPGRLVFANGGSDVSTSLPGRTELALKTWHHAILVRDGKRVRVFLNGDPEPEIQGEIEPGLRSDSPQMFFGGRSDNAANFEGKLDEIAVYARALSAAEAVAHFQAAGLAPSVAPSPVNHRPGAPVSATNAASVLGALRPAARWLAPGVQGRTLLNAAGQTSSEATAEGAVELPRADAATVGFAGGRLRAELPGLGGRYTVAFWFFNELPLSTRAVTAYLFSRGADGAEGAPGDHLGIGGNHSHQGRLILFNGNQRDQLLAGRSDVAPQAWHYVVLVRDGLRVSVFLNGRRDPEISGELEPGHAPGVDQIFFGGRSDNFANLQGRMSDLAVFRRALTAEEISELMKAAGGDSTVRAAGGARAEAPRPPPVASPPISPAESLAKIHVRAGFQVELVAAEPLLESPVAIDWDEHGRLWVAEMIDYPLGLDGQGKPGGRVRFLEDTDGDGRYDKSTVFAENLKFPTGLLTWRDGVIVTAAPEILFLADTDGDGKADTRRVLISGFFEGNQQLRVNGLRWGLDNWVYCASGAAWRGYGPGANLKSPVNGREYATGSRDFRFRPDTGDLDPQSGPTQFGRERDDWGNWFGVQNSWPLWHYVLQDPYLRRNPHVAAPDPVRQLVRPMNPRIYPVSPREKRFHSFDQAGHFTSACAAMIYRDDLLFGAGGPQHAFTCEPFHNLVQHNVISDDGVSFAARRDEEETAHDFFASEDRWCRPVMTRTGPDGALWVVDMYRYMIEHPEWLPAEGKAELLPHYRLGEDRGRIYRVYPRARPPRRVVPLAKLTTPELVRALDSSNGWQRDKAQMLLLWRNDPAAASFLESLAQNSTNPLARLHALCTLDGLGRLPANLIERALADPSPGVRVNALRLAEPHPTPALIEAAVQLVEDPDPKVHLQLASTLGEWKDLRAGAALGQLAVRWHSDPFITAAVLSSALPHHRALADAVVSAGGAARATYSEPLIHVSLATNQRDPLARLLQPMLAPVQGEFSVEQMKSFQRFLELLERRKTTWRELRQRPPEQPGNVDDDDELARRLQGVPELFNAAHRLALDSAQPALDRVAAAGLLARDESSRSNALSLLAALLSPKTPGEAQRAAIRVLGVSGDATVPERFVQAWPGLGPESRLAALDEWLGREPWALDLVRRLEQGRILPGALDASRRERLLRHSSARVKQAATKVLSTNERPTRSQVVADFRAALTLSGDAARGTPIFAKLCATCHQLGGKGTDLGPNLQSVANHPPEKLLVSILDPNASIQPGYTAYTAHLTGGEELYGIIAAETGNSVVLRMPDGKTRTLLRSELDSLESGNLSLMPEGLDAGLSHQDLADLIRALQGGGADQP